MNTNISHPEKYYIRIFSLGIGILVVLLGIFASIAYGAADIPIAKILTAIINYDNSTEHIIIRSMRLPRTLIASMVGASLATAGALMQGLTQNPLAAFGDAFVVACLIYLLAGTGEKSPLRLVLVGVALAAIMGAFTTLMLTFGQINNVSRALVWLAGSVAGKSWEQVWQLLPWIVIFVPFALLLARELDTLQLGDLVAKGLGSRVTWQRSKLLLVSVALAGSSVAISGTIGFVGLMAPHLARRLVGSMHKNLLPVAALIGGLLVAAADFLGRTLFSPTELPCGLLTAALGAPYFIYLMYQRRSLLV